MAALGLIVGLILHPGGPMTAASASSGEALSASPSPFDLKIVCDTCSGKDAPTCSSQDCTEGCVSKGNQYQCFKSDAGKFGCCCDASQMPKEDTYKCTRSTTNGTCLWGCCKWNVFDHKVAPVRCGDGCCPPSTHGSIHKCGESLYPVSRHGKGGKPKHVPCCMPQESSVEQQRREKCCTHGSGIDCDSPHGNDTCCLWTASALAWSGDRHAPCQRKTCKYYQKCDYGVGFNCTQEGRKTCCLSAGDITTRDPCQRELSDCMAGGRYEPCFNGVGRKCDSEGRGACCLDDGHDAGACSSDCDEFLRRQLQQLLEHGAVALCALIMVVVFLWCCRNRLKRLLSFCAHYCCRRQRSESHSVLLSSGLLDHLSPPKSFVRRVALLITCSVYLNLDYLPRADGDGVEMEKCLLLLGYIVYRFPAATQADMEKGFRDMVRAISGLEHTLVVVWFGGHAVEINGVLMWAGADALKGEPTTHVVVKDVCQRLSEIHHEDGAAKFGSSEAARNACFVFFENCCRTPPNELSTAEEFKNHLTLLPSAHKAPSGHERRWGKRPSFAFVYSADSGRPAIDSVRSGDKHSPFTAAVLEHLLKPQSLSSFCTSVSVSLKEATQGRMRLCTQMHPEVCKDISLVAVSIAGQSSISQSPTAASDSRG